MSAEINIDIALEKIHELQREGGDLGARYWYEISLLLKDAQKYKARALDAETKLAEIRAAPAQATKRAVRGSGNR